MRVLRQVGALAGAETFGRGTAWLTLFLLPWLISSEEYGIVVLIATFEAVATGFLLLGQDRAVMWKYAGQAEPGSDRSTVGMAVAITTSACLAGLIVGLFVAPWTGGALLGVPVWPHLVLLAVAVILVNVNRVALAFARIARMTRQFVVNRVAVGSLRLGCTLGLGAVSGSSLSYPVGMAVGTLLGGSRLWKRVVPSRWPTGGAKERIATLVRYGTPLSAHLLAMTSIRFVDRWVIGAFLGLAVVGSYSWYYMIGSAVTFLYAALSVYYEPEIYRERQRNPESKRVVHQYLGASLMAAGAYSLIGSVVAMFAGGSVPASVDADPEIVRIVLVAHWIHPIYLVCNYLLSSVGRTAPVAFISVITVGMAVGANLLLVPSFGAIGGAWSTLIGTVGLASAGWLVVRTIGIRVPLLQPVLVLAVLACLALAWPGMWTMLGASACLLSYGSHQVRVYSRRTPETMNEVA